MLPRIQTGSPTSKLLIRSTIPSLSLATNSLRYANWTFGASTVLIASIMPSLKQRARWNVNVRKSEALAFTFRFLDLWALCAFPSLNKLIQMRRQYEWDYSIFETYGEKCKGKNKRENAYKCVEKRSNKGAAFLNFIHNSAVIRNTSKCLIIEFYVIRENLYFMMLTNSNDSLSLYYDIHVKKKEKKNYQSYVLIIMYCMHEK